MWFWEGEDDEGFDFLCLRDEDSFFGADAVLRTEAAGGGADEDGAREGSASILVLLASLFVTDWDADYSTNIRIRVRFLAPNRHLYSGHAPLGAERTS